MSYYLLLLDGIALDVGLGFGSGFKPDFEPVFGPGFDTVFLTIDLVELNLGLTFRTSITRPIFKMMIIAPRIIMALCFLIKDVQYVHDNKLLFLKIVIFRKCYQK